MHGDLGDRKSIIISEEDYRTYERCRPGVATKVKQLLLEHPVLFIGFSLSDPNFTVIDGWIRDTVGNLKLPSVALMHGDVSSAERTLWKRRGIDLVPYTNGSALPIFQWLAAKRDERATASEQAEHRIRQLVKNVEEVVGAGGSGIKSGVALLLKRADLGDVREAARTILDGRSSLMTLDELEGVLEALDPVVRAT